MKRDLSIFNDLKSDPQYIYRYVKVGEDSYVFIDSKRKDSDYLDRLDIWTDRIYNALKYIQDYILIDTNNIDQNNSISQPKAGSNLNANGNYENALISSLALMLMADGKIEDDEIDIAVEFIKEEDFIEDKENAIEKLINIIEDLKSAKADAIFKLKAKKLMLAIEKITDSELIERIKIMIDGMLEASGDSNNEKNISMMKKITSLFCDETVV